MRSHPTRFHPEEDVLVIVILTY